MYRNLPESSIDQQDDGDAVSLRLHLRRQEVRCMYLLYLNHVCYSKNCFEQWHIFCRTNKESHVLELFSWWSISE